MNLHFLLVVLIALAHALPSAFAEAPWQASAKIATEGGLVQGKKEHGIVAFKGIPYARPPIGDLRWRPPQPVQSWKGVRDAGQLPADCMQTPFAPPPPGGRHATAEDCLYLNIWRPSTPNDPLPVMVWLHGGGFVNGGSSSLDSTGESMATRGLVFVSLNYRLGHFGYFGFPALNAEHPEEPKGNYGLMDQIAAVQWIARNIAGFGGDPHNITVVGESAGGISVNMLLTSPAAKGLFQRAIVMSGGGRKLPPERYLFKDIPGAKSAIHLGIAFARKHNIAGEDAKALAALRSLSAAQIAEGLNLATVLNADFFFAGPVIDGGLIVETLQTAFAAGHQQRVPLIIGATTWDLGINLAKTPDEAFAAFGADAEAARRAYDPDGRGNIQAINIAIAGDRAMVEPARFIARAMRVTGTTTYEYRFGYVLEAKRTESPFGAQHASDVPFAFDRLQAMYGSIVTPADLKVSGAMADYWANFARTGDPNGEGLPTWSPYHAEEDLLLDFGADGVIATKPDPWRSRLDVAERASTQKMGAAAEAVGSTSSDRTANLPASYEGGLPCADCPAIHYHLDLFPDHLYFLRTTYEGKPHQFDTIGSWELAKDGSQIILAGGKSGPRGFAIEEDASLRWLKREGTEFTSASQYVLKRTTAFQPIEPRAAITGMYRYFADSGVFTPCGTQFRLSVAQERANAQLEADYTRIVSTPGSEVAAQLEGEIAMRPKMEGTGSQPTLVVERVIHLQQGQTCSALVTAFILEDTQWKLTHLGDTPVILKEKQAEPYFVLQSEPHRVVGSSGCNRMTSQYTLDGVNLKFDNMISTRMACLAGMDTEKAFLSTLERVRTWRIDDQKLALFDVEGKCVARLEARLP